MKPNRLLLTIGILLAVIFGLWLCVFQVRKSEVAVLTTFDKITATETNAGAHLKWPPPIQMVHKFDRRIQNFEDKYDESLTADGFNLMNMVYVGWQISDAAAFFPKFKNGSIGEAEKTLEELVRNAKKAVIGTNLLSNFVSTDEQQLKIAEIEGQILKLVQDQVNTNNYGMRLEFLGFKRLGFPESVTQEVLKQMQSERQLRSSSITSDGEREASKIKSAADSSGAQTVNRAAAEAMRIKGEGLAEAAKSFAVFEQEPEFANFLLTLDALELSLKSKATLVFDGNNVPFNAFKGISTNLSNLK